MAKARASHLRLLGGFGSVLFFWFSNSFMFAHLLNRLKESTMLSKPFTHEIESDPKTGWKVYVLKYQDPKDPMTSIMARIVPAAGSNLYSLEVGGTEVLVTPPDLSVLPGFRYGIPVLYPMPNRVRDSQFRFDGHTYTFTPNERSHFLHGLVHSLKWEAGTPTCDGKGITLKTWLNWNAASPDYRLFPFAHRLSLTYRLNEQGIRLDFSVENQDQKPLPFGFALHPWFRVLGARSATYLHVPAQKHMEAEGLLPTGKLESLDGSPYDLRKQVLLEKLDLDDVYWGLTPEQPAGYECRDKGVKVTLAASKEFTHMVIYTPKGQPFFCMENQTCSTDAHNLFAKGRQEEAHLLIAKRGKPVTGWVKIKIERQPQ